MLLPPTPAWLLYGAGLSARGDNYTEWRSARTVALRYAGLWLIVSSKKTKPAAVAGPGAEAREKPIDKWDADDNKAMVMLLSSVHNDLTMSIASCDTSPEAWKHLGSRFDRDTGIASITLFRSRTNLRYADGDDPRLHLDEFHQRWTRMAKRCAGSSQSVAKVMKAMFVSDEVKGSFFLATLPDTIDHVIDNLGSRDVTKFVDIEPKIPDISDRHSPDADSSIASVAKQSAARGAKQNQGGAHGTRPATATASECSWCRKHNMTFIGHRNGAPNEKKTGAKLQKANNATTVEPSDDEEDEDSATEVAGFTAHYNHASNAAARATIDLTGSPLQSTRTTMINANSKRSRETLSAHAAIRRPSAIVPPTVWLLDTGASRHMTGCADDFVPLSPKQGRITVTGGIKLPIDGFGLVRLRYRMPDGSTKVFELTNVLYSSELYGTRLFSWSYVRHHHNLELHGKGNDVFITRNGTTALWARGHGTLAAAYKSKPGRPIDDPKRQPVVRGGGEAVHTADFLKNISSHAGDKLGRQIKDRRPSGDTFATPPTSPTPYISSCPTNWLPGQPQVATRSKPETMSPDLRSKSMKHEHLKVRQPPVLFTPFAHFHRLVS
ncbi:hypothetical protein HBH99_249140 [Parastagonospora nodorum]|nr:hypothetical protein HBH97_247860 [Parastagonospora nodorum]KAH4368372.1 hypothetical protein HBH99_249140 [Parastagonospora nodorum]